MYHLVATMFPFIFTSYCNCNRLEIIINLLRGAKIAITHLIYSPSQQNFKNIEAHKNPLGVSFEKKSVTAILLEKIAWHTNGCTHARTHIHDPFHNLPSRATAQHNKKTWFCITKTVQQKILNKYKHNVVKMILLLLCLWDT